MNPRANDQPANSGDSTQGSRFDRRWPLRIALFGYFVPPVIGVCVRSYLVHIGKPVVEWSWIFGSPRLIVFLALLVYWDVPFLLVAALAHRRPLTNPANRPLVVGAFLGTLAASVFLFADLWRNIEAVMIGALVIPFFILPGTLVGLALGWLVAHMIPAPAIPNH